MDRVLTKRKALCEKCHQLVDAELVTNEKGAFYVKHCEMCGVPSVVELADDRDYFHTAYEYGQKIRCRGVRALIIELTEDCNLSCPICIASSGPGKGSYKSMDEIKALILSAERNQPEILMLSGGEPTIHPNFERIVEMAILSSIPRVVIITNGSQMALDNGLVERLSMHRDRLEVYLQFDTLNSNVLTTLRGEDLTQTRTNALQNLELHRIDTTLICVVQKSLNDHLLDETIQVALANSNVRGITFQPLKMTGKAGALAIPPPAMLLTATRKRLLSITSNEEPIELVPHPLSPECIAIGYYRRDGTQLRPITNTVLDATSAACRTARESLFLLPGDDPPDLRFEDVIRIAIVCYMDSRTFAEEVLPQCLIGFVNREGRIVSLEEHYLFGK